MSAFYALCLYTCLSLKLTSYYAVNRAYRDIRRQKTEESKEINNNRSNVNLNHSKSEGSFKDLNIAAYHASLLQLNLVEYPGNLNFKGKHSIGI